jgi:hypothetical protein
MAEPNWKIPKAKKDLGAWLNSQTLSWNPSIIKEKGNGEKQVWGNAAQMDLCLFLSLEDQIRVSS